MPAPDELTGEPIAELTAGVLAGDRVALARAITLIESSLSLDAPKAQALLGALLDKTSPDTIRVGITGVPGVGKSTFIEVLGQKLTAKGRSVAVLAVDPTSVRTGGSIMGDKTRMTSLANDESAFVRPSPTSGNLGGVQARTRETISVCEAAGFEITLVETVGVGQSELAVASMVDFFLVLMAPGAGDELQGIKKGILELADLIAINKADGTDIERAEQTCVSYRRALELTTPLSSNWSPPVLTCSALGGEGLDEIWQRVEAHRAALSESGELAQKRQDQRVKHLGELLSLELATRLGSHPAVAALKPRLEEEVRANRITPEAAAAQLLEVFAS